jgi:hypothetical protein
MAKKVKAEEAPKVEEAQTPAQAEVSATPPASEPKVDEQKVEEVTEKITSAVTDRVVSGIKDKLNSVFGEEASSTLSEEAEKVVSDSVAADEQGEVRQEISGLPSEAQALWLKDYVNAKAYALTQEDLKAEPRKFANRSAWTSVSKRYVKANGQWGLKSASIKFDASAGKWIVDSRRLMGPVMFANQADAENAFKLLADSAAPEVKQTEDEKFEITHPDWQEPVVTSTVEEAAEVATKKLVDEGWSDTEAKPKADEIVQAARKEKVMASIEVKADTSQNTKGGHKGQLVGGVTPKTEGITQGKKPKDSAPDVGGHVTTEGPAVDAVPATESHPAQATYEKQAMAHDKLVKQLQGKHGLMKVAAALSETLEPKEVANTLSVLYAAEITPEAREFISKKVSVLRSEGKTEDEALGQAYSMAREAGYEVPEKK